MAFADAITDVELSCHKAILHVEKLQALAAGEDVLPVTVELDLVDFCNHRCPWCVDPHHGHNRLDPQFTLRLMGELRSLGVGGLVFKGGGECTLHEQFAQLLEAGRGLGFEVGLVTNGSRLEALAGPVARHANYVRVSIDGPTASAHNAVHGTDDFERIVAGVEKLVAQRRRNEHRHPVIGLSFAMDYAAVGLVNQAVDLGDRLGVDYVLLRTPFFEEVDRAATMTVSQAREVRNSFQAARDAYHGPMAVLVDHWISDREAADASERPEASPRRGAYRADGTNGIEHVTRRCLASPLLAVVTAEQKVFPCCNLRFLDDWYIGTVDYENDVTFLQVWSGPRRREVLERIRRFGCETHCTHPLSRYNEIIEYLAGPRYHGNFI